MTQLLKPRFTTKNIRNSWSNGAQLDMSPSPWGDDILRNLGSHVALALGLSLSTHPSKPLFYIHATPEWPLSYLLYGALHIPILIYVHFKRKFFLCWGVFNSGFGLWGGRSMNSSKHLVHLHDGISRAASPILRTNGKAHAVAKMNGKCQGVHLFVPSLGLLPNPKRHLAFIKMWHSSFQSEFIFLS